MIVFNRTEEDHERKRIRFGVHIRFCGRDMTFGFAYSVLSKGC